MWILESHVDQTCSINTATSSSSCSVASHGITLSQSVRAPPSTPSSPPSALSLALALALALVLALVLALASKHSAKSAAS